MRARWIFVSRAAPAFCCHFLVQNANSFARRHHQQYSSRPNWIMFSSSTSQGLWAQGERKVYIEIKWAIHLFPTAFLIPGHFYLYSVSFGIIQKKRKKSFIVCIWIHLKKWECTILLYTANDFEKIKWNFHLGSDSIRTKRLHLLPSHLFFYF